MSFAFVAVPAAPVRRKPRHQHEMTNQLLFGEGVKILKSKGSLWVKIRSMHDQYEGWMTQNLLVEADEEAVVAGSTFFTTDMLNTISINGKSMQVPIGASLPGFAESAGKLGTQAYDFNGNRASATDMNASGERLERLTSAWLNAPYCWGGRTILGVDCSGFVQVNYKMIGIQLPRDAWQQAQEGHAVKKLKDAQPGDLAFFDDKDEIVHVGMLLSPETIIHASGRVRIDTIDKNGIINSDTGKRSHRLRAIRRYF